MTKIDRNVVWAVVHAERTALASDLAELDLAAWRTPSLCPGWSVHDVLAHLIDVAKTTRLGFARRLIAAKFDFDRDNQIGVDRERCDDPQETLQRWRDVTSATSTPPAALETRLVEAFVHGEDIRRPLGLVGSYPADAVAAALAYQVRTSTKWGGGKERAAELQLICSDDDLRCGAGPEVRGRAISLLLAVSGRAVDDSEFDGPGAPVLLERLRSENA